MQDQALYFQCFRPDEDFAGFGRYYAISKDDFLIREVSGEEIESLQEPAEAGSATTPYAQILMSCLSPDGNYCLLVVSNSGRDSIGGRLLLVRLADLAQTEIRGIDPSGILTPPLSRNVYAPGIEWNTKALLISMRDGLKSYVLEQH